MKRPGFEARILVSQKGLLVAPDNAFTPGINGGLGAVAEVQFAEDIADVSLDRLGAEAEAVGDLAVVLSLRDELENFQFAAGEGIERGFVACHFLHEPLGYAGMESRFMSRGGANSVDYFIR